MLVNSNEDITQRDGSESRRIERTGDPLSSRSCHRHKRRRRHKRSQRQNINEAAPSNLNSPNTTNATASTASSSNVDDDNYEKPTIKWLFKQLAINYTIAAISVAITGSFIYWMETSFEKRVLKNNRILRSDTFKTVISQFSDNLLLPTNGGNAVESTGGLFYASPISTITKNSPQAHALEWLVRYDPLHLSPWNTTSEYDIIERYTLATMYYSMSSSEVLSKSRPFKNFEANYTIRGVDVFDNCGSGNFNPYMFINGSQFTDDVSVQSDDDDDYNTNDFLMTFGNSNKPWLSKYSVCHWQGIHCNYKDRITRIQLGE